MGIILLIVSLESDIVFVWSADRLRSIMIVIGSTGTYVMATVVILVVMKFMVIRC